MTTQVCPHLDRPGSTLCTELTIDAEDEAKGASQPRQLSLPDHLTTGQAAIFKSTCRGLEKAERHRDIGSGPRGFGLDTGSIRCPEVRVEDLLEHAVDQCPLVPRVDGVCPGAVLQGTDPQDLTDEVAGGTRGPYLERRRRHAPIHPLTQLPHREWPCMAGPWAKLARRPGPAGGNAQQQPRVISSERVQAPAHRYGHVEIVRGCERGRPIERGYERGAVSYTHLRAHETDSYLVC